MRGEASSRPPATPTTGPEDYRRSHLPPSTSRLRASRSTAKRWCWAQTACRGSRICAEGTPRIRRSSTPSTLSNTTARICGIARSSTAKPPWRGCCAILRRASCSTNTLPRTALRCSSTLAGSAPRASSQRGRRNLSIGAVLGLGQSPQSRQHRGAARARRDVEQVILQGHHRARPSSLQSRDYKLARSSRSWPLVLVPLHRGLEGHALSLGFASADSAIFSAPNRNVLRLERNLVLAHILILPPVAPTESLLHLWFQNRCLVSSGKVAELQE